MGICAFAECDFWSVCRDRRPIFGQKRDTSAFVEARVYKGFCLKGSDFRRGGMALVIRGRFLPPPLDYQPARTGGVAGAVRLS